MHFKTLIAAALCLSALHGAASAGEFSVFCSYKNDNLERCADAVSDIVTDKFTAKFPSSQYQIFLHSNIHHYTNGGFGAYAVAGVIPRGSAMFPVRTFSATSINGTDKNFGAIEQAGIERDVYRSAAKSLIDACEVSPSCDVYVKRVK